MGVAPPGEVHEVEGRCARDRRACRPVDLALVASLASSRLYICMIRVNRVIDKVLDCEFVMVVFRTWGREVAMIAATHRRGEWWCSELGLLELVRVDRVLEGARALEEGLDGDALADEVDVPV